MFSVLNSTTLNGNNGIVLTGFSIVEFSGVASELHTEQRPVVLGSRSSGRVMMYAYAQVAPVKIKTVAQGSFKQVTVKVSSEKDFQQEFITIGSFKQVTVRVFPKKDFQKEFQTNADATAFRLYNHTFTKDVELVFKSKIIRLFETYKENSSEKRFILYPDDLTNESQINMAELIRDYVWVIEYENREVILMDGHVKHTFPVKQPNSRLSYDVIADLWLEDGDYIEDVVLLEKDEELRFEINELVFSEDHKKFKMWVSEGLDGKTHKVSLLLKTKSQLKKEIDLFFPVEDF